MEHEIRLRRRRGPTGTRPGEQTLGVLYLDRHSVRSPHLPSPLYTTKPTNPGSRLFLTIATYLIFGSWLNYNRHGARGWDLLPHGDAIRDIPYLLKDWVRRLLNTVQGSGSRGGYSAV